MRLPLKQAEREIPVIVSLVREELPEAANRDLQQALDHVIERLMNWSRSDGEFPLVRDLVAEIFD